MRKPLGTFSREYRANKQSANILGRINPISIESSYVLIQLHEFIPKKDLVPDGVDIAKNDAGINVILSKLQSNGIIIGNVVAYVDFFDRKNNEVLFSFRNVRINFDGKSMVTHG